MQRRPRSGFPRVLRRRSISALTFVLLVLVGLNGLTRSVSAQSNYVAPYNFATLAGLLPGNADGTGSTARFNNPYGVAVGSAGNVYVADTFNQTIRKITPTGEVTTLAGTAGQDGSADGTGGTAQFAHPLGVAVDNSGNIYVADTFNDTIRKITPAGVVTTLAGTAGQGGSADGTGSAAQFDSPSGVAVDGGGNVYVADTNNDTIRKITPAGVVTTLAGTAGQGGSADGTGSAAGFSFPYGVAVDSAGMVYVADTFNQTIRKITPAGVVTTLAGTAGQGGSADGTGRAAGFSFPYGVAVDSAGHVYVADFQNNTIRKITPAGAVTTLAGDANLFGSADGTGRIAQFDEPYGVAVDGAGRVYVTDTSNNTIRKGSPAGVPAFTEQPVAQAAAPGDSIVLSAVTNDILPTVPVYQWRLNGKALDGASGESLSINDLQPANAGIYVATATTGDTIFASVPAIVGLLTTNAVVGDGGVADTGIVHPNGNLFDQVLLTGDAESMATQEGRITRTSFIDLNDDIVQVEFAGRGTLSLVLDAPSGPAAAHNYNQPAVDYMKGHAGIVIVGADETTNVAVFTVGRATAFDPTGTYNILLAPSTTNVPASNGSPLFAGHADTHYDGHADIAFIAILSTDGKFGGLRASNANFFAAQGYTGVYAPGVAFQGPVFIGNIDAFDGAMPVIVIGSAADARITGGSLAQDNGSAVQVSGLTQLKFTGGSDSEGNALPAQQNAAVLEQDGVDVTDHIVVNPGP